MASVPLSAEPIQILLVEDNPGDAVLIAEAMYDNKIKNEVHHVSDGIEALDYLRQHGTGRMRPDLILLDLNLPRMDGREVLEQIKNDPALKTIPVVVLTTSLQTEDIERSYRLHANCYVTKPLDLDQFINIVKAIEHFWVSIVRLPAPSPEVASD